MDPEPSGTFYFQLPMCLVATTATTTAVVKTIRFGV